MPLLQYENVECSADDELLKKERNKKAKYIVENEAFESEIE